MISSTLAHSRKLSGIVYSRIFGTGPNFSQSQYHYISFSLYMKLRTEAYLARDCKQQIIRSMNSSKIEAQDASQGTIGEGVIHSAWPARPINARILIGNGGRQARLSYFGKPISRTVVADWIRKHAETFDCA